MMQRLQGRSPAFTHGGMILSYMVPPLGTLPMHPSPGIFGDTNVKITCEGRPYLGSALGRRSYTSDFVTGKVEQWTKELKSLSKIATSQPHAAFTVTPMAWPASGHISPVPSQT